MVPLLSNIPAHLLRCMNKLFWMYNAYISSLYQSPIVSSSVIAIFVLKGMFWAKYKLGCVSVPNYFCGTVFLQQENT